MLLEVFIVDTFLTIIHVIFAIVIIVLVLFQSGAQQGLSGSIAGGAETFFGKNKARTLDGILSKCTTVVSILFIATSIVLSLILK